DDGIAGNKVGAADDDAAEVGADGRGEPRDEGRGGDGESIRAGGAAGGGGDDDWAVARSGRDVDGELAGGRDGGGDGGGAGELDGGGAGNEIGSRNHDRRPSLAGGGNEAGDVRGDGEGRGTGDGGAVDGEVKGTGGGADGDDGLDFGIGNDDEICVDGLVGVELEKSGCREPRAGDGDEIAGLAGSGRKTRDRGGAGRFACCQY